MQNIAYNATKYRFVGSATLDGSIVNVTCAVDIPEGSVVSLNSSGQAILATASTVPIGVARYPRRAGTTLAIENDCIIENKGSTLNLTPGTVVYAAAAGAVAGTGTNVVGYALTANLIKISL